MSTRRDRIHILNGPNINLLGEREPEHYGTTTLAQIGERCAERCAELGFDPVFRQSNHEGVLVDWMQEASLDAAGVVVNPAAYSHGSVAILDAMRACRCPVIEVHLSNPLGREDYRRVLRTSQGATATIIGLGADGYLLAIDALVRLLAGKEE